MGDLQTWLKSEMAWAISHLVNPKEPIMAKHKVKKHGKHSKLKIHGGFKSMEHKRSKRKRG